MSILQRFEDVVRLVNFDFLRWAAPIEMNLAEPDPVNPWHVGADQRGLAKLAQGFECVLAVARKMITATKDVPPELATVLGLLRGRAGVDAQFADLGLIGDDVVFERPEADAPGFFAIK